jgi:hypothetical protein
MHAKMVAERKPVVEPPTKICAKDGLRCVAPIHCAKSGCQDPGEPPAPDAELIAELIDPPYLLGDGSGRTGKAMKKAADRLASLAEELARVKAERDEARSPLSGMRTALRNANLRQLDAERQLAAAKRELTNIRDAKPYEWDADTRDQFQQWAQNRARAALEQLDKGQG